MRFYYENSYGDRGYFTLKKTEIPKAIMSVWNIEGELSIVVEKIGKHTERRQIIFDSFESNECNNDWLSEYGLYIKDGEKYRELHYIKDDSFAWEPDNYDGLLRLV